MTNSWWTIKFSSSGDGFLFFSPNILYFLVFIYVCIINSEGRIIEEAKKKNEVKFVRSVSELSGQVEEPDKER